MFMEIVERIIVMLWRKLCANKPALGEFFFTVGHVFSTKYTKRKHLLGSKLRLEVRIKIPAHWLGELITIICLHLIANFYSSFSHML